MLLHLLFLVEHSLLLIVEHGEGISQGGFGIRACNTHKEYVIWLWYNESVMMSLITGNSNSIQ